MEERQCCACSFRNCVDVLANFRRQIIVDRQMDLTNTLNMVQVTDESRSLVQETPPSPRSYPTSCTIVIKLGRSVIMKHQKEIYWRLFIGTSSIVHEKTHLPLLSLLSSVVETVMDLKEQGHRVILVSSGAIATGLKRMRMPVKPKSLSGKQAR